MTSVFTSEDIPPHPPVDDRHPLLPPIEFPVRRDPALDCGRGARPDTVHIAPRGGAR